MSPTTGWAVSKQPYLAALSVSSMSWLSPLRMAESGKGNGRQESFHPITPFCPFWQIFQFYLLSSTSPHRHHHCKGRSRLPAQDSLQGPGIKLPVSQLLPPIPPPHCETNNTSWTLDRNPAYQRVPGRWTLGFNAWKTPVYIHSHCFPQLLHNTETSSSITFALVIQVFPEALKRKQV